MRAIEADGGCPLRAAAFLDRDGTIIVEKDYLADPDLVAIEAGAIEGLKMLAAERYVLVVVSNQSGIGRGYFSREQAEAVNQRVDALLRAEGVEIAGWYMCPHEPDSDCQCRKPRPGLVHAAAADLGLDLARSVVIGDKRSDVELAHAIGGTGILVTTGHGLKHRAWAYASGAAVCSDLRDAAQILAS